MKNFYVILAALTSALQLAATTAAAPIADGTQFGIDIGPTFTSNWNNFNSNSTIGAGSITDLSGTTIDGVSIATSNGQFYNNDGTNSWTGLSSNSGSAPPQFVESVVTDIGGNFSLGDGTPFTITLDGLDTSLEYDIVAVSTANFGPIDTYSVIGEEVYGPSAISRPDAQSTGLFHSFTSVVPDALGTIVIEVVDTNTSANPIVNGVLVTASAPTVVPEPTAVAVWSLIGIGLIGYGRRRKRLQN